MRPDPASKLVERYTVLGFMVPFLFPHSVLPDSVVFIDDKSSSLMSRRFGDKNDFFFSWEPLTACVMLLSTDQVPCKGRLTEGLSVHCHSCHQLPLTVWSWENDLAMLCLFFSSEK